MLIGSQVGLRAVEQSDLEKLRDWRNIQKFRRNFREHRELSLENQKSWFDRLSKSSNDFMFVIEDLQTHEPIGACGLLYTNWIIRSADFSFYIGKNSAYIDENGLAKDAASLLMKYGFCDLNLNKIWMELYEFDQKKVDFFTNQFNFKIDGRLRANCFADGKYWDSIIISLLQSEFAH